MTNIFKELSTNNTLSKKSRVNARDYTDRLLQSVSTIKHIERLCNITDEVKRLYSTDTIVKTPLEFEGFTHITMAFNADSSIPYAAKLECKEESKE